MHESKKDFYDVGFEVGAEGLSQLTFVILFVRIDKIDKVN